MVVDVLRMAGLLEDAVPHDRDPVSHRHRLHLVVRDVDRRRLELVLDPRHLGAHLDAQACVEVRERLVHQEHARLADDRATHRNALSLAAGELTRLAVEKLRQAEHVADLLDAPIDLPPSGSGAP